MPCWYFERKEIKNSPSYRDGIDSNTENRYIREGARFILDAGTKMMLRYDTCATGVVYFHRFYMYHSFKDFYRYLTAACCLFLAGKVEETPKKCKDIIKAAQLLLSPASFQRFGEDPREEVITMERILLKTIKFDLQVEHPYVYMLKTAKMFKGSDKEKTQKMAQMAWTFINDSLCTTLCLQWEPEIISISLMYLASRLTKFEPTDWVGRSSSKSKWWQDFVEGMTLELMEDICHQVLDLYSNKQSKKAAEVDSPVHTPKKAEESPPPPPPPERPPGKRSREVTPSEGEGVAAKVPKHEREGKMSSSKPSSKTPVTVGAPIPVAQHISSLASSSSGTGSKTSSSYSKDSRPAPVLAPLTSDFSSYNPYVSSQMYSSSFLSQEGSQNIQSILAGNSAPPPSSSAYPVEPKQPYAPPTAEAASAGSHYHHHPPSSATGEAAYNYPHAPSGMPSYTVPQQQSYSTGAPPSSYNPYPNAPAYPSYPVATQSSSYPPAPQGPSYSVPPSQQSYGGYPYPPGSGSSMPPGPIPAPTAPPLGQRDSYSYPSQGASSTYGAGPARADGRGYHPPGRDRKDIPSLTEMKIPGPTWASHSGNP